MENLDLIWCFVDFKSLIANEQTIATERHWIIDKLNQPLYFKKCLHFFKTSK